MSEVPLESASVQVAQRGNVLATRSRQASLQGYLAHKKTHPLLGPFSHSRSFARTDSYLFMSRSGAVQTFHSRSYLKWILNDNCVAKEIDCTNFLILLLLVKNMLCSKVYDQKV